MTAIPQVAAEPAGIPRILHQIYFGGESAAPPSYRKWAETWRANHPEWDHQFWDAQRCRALVAEHYAWFLPVYDAYKHRIQRCDAIRYFILHRFGGMYVDMDVESLRPIDDLIAGRDLILGALRVGFTNAVMGSAPGHPLWPRTFETMQQRCRRYARSAPLWAKVAMPMHIGYSTGPIMLTDCLRETGHDQPDQPRVNICPSYVFEPLSGGGGSAGAPVDLSRSYAIHHMSMHWLPRRHKFMGAVLNTVGALFMRRSNATATPAAISPVDDDRRT
jgi:mannosyltransferase OCH1-like enzyme